MIKLEFHVVYFYIKHTDRLIKKSKSFLLLNGISQKAPIMWQVMIDKYSAAALILLFKNMQIKRFNALVICNSTLIVL